MVHTGYCEHCADYYECEDCRGTKKAIRIVVRAFRKDIPAPVPHRHASYIEIPRTDKEREADYQANPDLYDEAGDL